MSTDETRLLEVADGLWCAEHDLFTGGLHFRTRMTVVRLGDGSLALISPIPIDDRLRAELDALGAVSELIAPNRLHHLFFGDAITAFPEAKTRAAPGLPEKRKDLAFDSVLGDEPHAAWESELDQALIAGIPALSEAVFLHRSSRTLIVTDLLFNIHECQGWLTKLVLKYVARAWQRPAQSRLVRFMTRDRGAARASVERVASWRFERLLMAHGRIIEGDAREAFELALGHMLERGAPSALPSRSAHAD